MSLFTHACSHTSAFGAVTCGFEYSEGDRLKQVPNPPGFLFLFPVPTFGSLFGCLTLVPTLLVTPFLTFSLPAAEPGHWRITSLCVGAASLVCVLLPVPVVWLWRTVGATCLLFLLC